MLQRERTMFFAKYLMKLLPSALRRLSASTRRCRKRPSFVRPICEELENRIVPSIAAPPGLGDINGDGYGDLVIGAPDGPNGGEVNVIYGSATGLTTANNQLWSQNSPGILDGSEAGDRFGAALAMGDFNHDGFADLVIGVPNEQLPNTAGVTVSAGAVHVLYGASSGLTATNNQFWHGGSPGIGLAVLGGDTTGDKFGASLAVGDFNNDGFEDLAIGIPERFTTNVGAALVLYGSASGLTSTGRQVWSQETNGIPDSATAGDLWASALAAGDFDHDGSDDLAIGAPGEDQGGTDSGAVTILYGNAGAGLGVASAQFWRQGTFAVEDSSEPGDRFGAALAVGDFNGDLLADLAIGIPGERTESFASLAPGPAFDAEEAGAISVLYGRADGLSAGDDQFLTNEVGVFDLGGGDLYGRALAAGDFNADGRDDLAIGIPLRDFSDASDAGGVEIRYGGTNGLTGRNFARQGIPPFFGTAVPNEYFGSALATADFNGDGKSDLAVGAPGENLLDDPNSKIGAGGVNITYGTATGLTGATHQFFSQDTPGILGVAEIGERFGQALAGSSPTGGAGFSGAWVSLVQSLDRKPHGPSSFRLQGALDIFNPGTQTADRSVVRFFLSDDAVLDAGDALVGESRLGPLKSQETRRVQFNATLKSSASGKYLIAVLDADNAVVEVNELNNTVVSGPLE
jgi:hypothetical protein